MSHNCRTSEKYSVRTECRVVVVMHAPFMVSDALSKVHSLKSYWSGHTVSAHMSCSLHVVQSCASAFCVCSYQRSMLDLMAPHHSRRIILQQVGPTPRSRFSGVSHSCPCGHLPYWWKVNADSRQQLQRCRTKCSHFSHNFAVLVHKHETAVM